MIIKCIFVTDLNTITNRREELFTFTIGAVPFRKQIKRLCRQSRRQYD